MQNVVLHYLQLCVLLVLFPTNIFEYLTTKRDEDYKTNLKLFKSTATRNSKLVY